MGKRIFTICVILLLTLLFILPCRFLSTLTNNIIDLSERAVVAVHSEDWQLGAQLLQELNLLFAANKKTMHLFLSHAIVEDIEARLQSCMELMYVQDQPQSLQELETVITRAHNLKSIESLTWFTLL